jgi:hypothetical protein
MLCSAEVTLCCLQAVLPFWLGRMPPSLTQLVLKPLYLWHGIWEDEVEEVFSKGYKLFLDIHLPALSSLRHLAFHGGDGVADQFLQRLCTAAGALPTLISLHLVRELS